MKITYIVFPLHAACKVSLIKSEKKDFNRRQPLKPMQEQGVRKIDCFYAADADLLREKKKLLYGWLPCLLDRFCG
jgi:hypothetical protein